MLNNKIEKKNQSYKKIIFLSNYKPKKTQAYSVQHTKPTNHVMRFGY
jgi:hypothetical protein